jgi:hypothetical protein
MDTIVSTFVCFFFFFFSGGMKTNVDTVLSILFLFDYLVCDCPKLYLFTIEIQFLPRRKRWAPSIMETG